MYDAPYLGRTLEDALKRADQDEIELRQVAQVNPSDYDRIILAQYIRILEAVCGPHLKLGNAGYPVGEDNV
jgi:formyltetrahydrofolate hydrolase